jgi:hypothetical protein
MITSPSGYPSNGQVGGDSTGECALHILLQMGLRFDTVSDEAAAAGRAASQPGFADRPVSGVE